MPTIINTVPELTAYWNHSYGIENNNGIFIIASNLYIDSSTDQAVAPTGAVSDCYFVCETIISRSLYNYINGTGAELNVTSCAFQLDTTMNPMNTDTDNIMDYTYESPTLGYTPFLNWNTSTVWSPNPTSTPLILTAFTGIPFQNYSEANDVPTLTGDSDFHHGRLRSR